MVRTAGKAAWVAPVIVAASAAPAMAASLINLDVVSMTAGRTNIILTTYPFTQLSVRNNAAVQHSGSRTVRIQVTPNSGSASGPQLSPNGDNTNWALGTAVAVGSGFRVDATHTGNLAASATTPNVRIYWTGAAAGSVSALVIAPSSPNNGAGAATYPA